jgi:hypothetical protein
MEKLPDLGAVYVELSDMTQPMLDVSFIILDEQGEEVMRLSLDCALSITEATQEYMEWVENLGKRNMH